MSGDGGGSQTPQVQNQTSVTTRPDWFNSILKNQVNTVGALNNALPGIQQDFMGGGSAPSGGVWNGGMPTTPSTPAQQPLPIPTRSVSGINPPAPGPTGPGGFPIQNQAPQYSGGQGMGAGIGNSFGAAQGGALSALSNNKG